jgi:hypothetical protein
MNVYSLNKEEVEKINLLKSNYPEIQELYNIIINQCQEIIDKLEKIYLDNKLELEEFENERSFMLKLSYLFFGFKTMSIAVTKAGTKLKQLSKIYNKVILEKKNILDEHTVKMNELNNQLEELKMNASKENKEKLELIQLKTKMKIIKEKEKIIAVPTNYGKMKTQSTCNFIDNINICLSDIEFDENGLIKVSGTSIIDKKNKMGLNGNDAPRINAHDNFGYKKI